MSYTEGTGCAKGVGGLINVGAEYPSKPEGIKILIAPHKGYWKWILSLHFLSSFSEECIMEAF